MRRTGLAVGLVLLAACGTGGSVDSQDVAAPAPPCRAGTAGDERLPVVEGARVRGSGQVVAVPGRPVRLCAPVPTADVGYPPGQEPAPQFCEFGVDVEGVDVTELAHRREKDGAVSGSAVLTGVWREGSVHVEVQESPPPAPVIGADGFGPHQVQTPPCPAPEGGWPRTFQGDNIDEAQPGMAAFLAEHPGARDFLAFFRPGPDQVLLGVAVHGEQARADAERLLRPLVGERLCITDARYTPEQVEAARADPALRPEPPPGPVYGSGTGISDDIQPVQSLDVVMITEDLLAAADRHPPGLVAFRPAVAVVAGSG